MEEERRRCSIFSIVLPHTKLAVHVCDILIQFESEMYCVNEVWSRLIILPEDRLRLGGSLQESGPTAC